MLCDIQEREIIVLVDVSIEAVVASNERKKRKRRGGGVKRNYKYTVMNVLVGQTRP